MSAKLFWAASVALSCVACGGSSAVVAEPELPTSADQSLVARGASADDALPGSNKAKEAAIAAPIEDAAEPVAADIKLADIEQACAGKKGICTPSAAVAKRLCTSKDPDLALAMFRKGTPWKRVYSRGDMEAWYAGGGRTKKREVRYAEELLIVADRSDAGNGMKMSGFGNYDVYRWDGSCVSMMVDEVTKFRPSTPDIATIHWRRLTDDTQDALLKNKRIKFRNDQRKRACKGSARHGDNCQFALHDLSRVIAQHAWEGRDVPVPTLLP